jgi:flagellar export protein FliJ
VSARFTFRLERVLYHRSHTQERVRQELADAIAAAADQQERAVAARCRADRELARLRELMGAAVPLADLRAIHADLVRARGAAAHEQEMVGQLEALADDLRADLVRASRDREALVRLVESPAARHPAAAARDEADALDEPALRRSARSRMSAA